MLGCEFPLNALLCTEVGNRVLCLPFAMELVDVDQFSSGAYEIGSVVAPDHREQNEYVCVSLGDDGLTDVSGLDQDWTSVIDTYFVENRSWSQSIGWQSIE